MAPDPKDINSNQPLLAVSDVCRVAALIRGRRAEKPTEWLGTGLLLHPENPAAVFGDAFRDLTNQPQIRLSCYGRC